MESLNDLMSTVFMNIVLSVLCLSFSLLPPCISAKRCFVDEKESKTRFYSVLLASLAGLVAIMGFLFFGVFSKIKTQESDGSVSVTETFSVLASLLQFSSGIYVFRAIVALGMAAFFVCWVLALTKNLPVWWLLIIGFIVSAASYLTGFVDYKGNFSTFTYGSSCWIPIIYGLLSLILYIYFALQSKKEKASSEKII
jgi:hypothetical protein